MINGWNIRKKLRIGIGLLLVAVAILAVGGFSNAYAFRSLVRSISRRATELPEAVTLAQHVSALRATLPQSAHVSHSASDDPGNETIGGLVLSMEFDRHLKDASQTLASYRDQLQRNAQGTSRIGDIRYETQTMDEMEQTLARIQQLRTQDRDNRWPTRDRVVRDELEERVERLNDLASELPSYLQKRMYDLQGDVRGHYRAWIILTWVTSILAALLLILMGRLFYRWVFHPLRLLVHGSRRVAEGDFQHRIALASGDEMQELAEAMNDMTERFQQIRDDLDAQVRERTREVIRSEQLASVGFLAAGVAHEINNPLAAIALCAESLEQRMTEWLALQPPPAAASTPDESPHELVQDYLGMIQKEAFRCKEITERLLDFSRLGDVEKQPVELQELVQGVVDMVRHVGRYKEKQIDFMPQSPLVAPVNAQEIKQVVLNLITNGLDSLDAGGTVRVRLGRHRQQAVLEVVDNGCGMTEEVRAHLFEPFFTRRRDGQGTGLGMSISFRIISEHGGTIEVHSDGPGHGSRVTVRLPLTSAVKESSHRHQAA